MLVVQVTVDEAACARVRETCALVASACAGGEVVSSQACYLPISADNVPLLGPVPGLSGAYVATGHGCWGILNGPASGLAMAELIMDGKAQCVDLSPFSMNR